MSIPAILAAGPLLSLGTEIAAGTVSAVSGGFADLLKGTLAAASPSADGDANDKPQTSSRVEHGRPSATLAGLTTTAALDTASLRDRTANLTSNFRGRLGQLLAEQGIDLPDALQLQLDPFGTIRVVGGSADSSQIEQIVNNDPQLSDLFRGISANLGLLTATEEVATFSQQFTENSLSAMDRAPHLFPAGQSPVVELAGTSARG